LPDAPVGEDDHVNIRPICREPKGTTSMERLKRIFRRDDGAATAEYAIATMAIVAL
jgi:hypothetical protein